MLPKLILLVLVGAVTASMLLVLRQQRLETVHEMSRVHERRVGRERALWTLRSEIARRCRPEAVRPMLRPLADEWIAIPDASSGTPGTDAPIATYVEDPAPAEPPAELAEAPVDGGASGG